MHPIIHCSLAAMVAILSACGGSSNGAAPSADTQPVGISHTAVRDIGAHQASLSFVTTPAASASIELWFDSDSDDAAPPRLSITSGQASQHTVELAGLWSASPWRVAINTANDQQTVTFTTSPPAWPEGCREGALLLPLSASGAWSRYTDDNGVIELSAVSGCNQADNAMRMEYDLGAGEWVVIASDDSFNPTLDLSKFTHLWVPFRGTQGTSAAFEIKLKDAFGSLAVARVDGGTGVPVWRSWAIDLREFAPQVGSLDLTAISSLEFAFSLPLSAAGARSGRVDVGSPSAWNLTDVRPVVTDFETVVKNTGAMAEIANDLLDRQQPHGFIPAWFDLEPNWHLYANAMALIVFSLEYERLQNLADNAAAQLYLAAATLLADRLVTLQQLSDRDGAWDDSFRESNGQLTLQPQGSRILWVGSTAWAGIALLFAYDILPQGEQYAGAISAAAQFYRDEQSCRSMAGLPEGAVTEGTEGNISSQLFLSAAAERGLADLSAAISLARFIDEQLFDAGQQRFFCGVRVDFGSGFDRTQCTLDGSAQITGRVALACLDVAANWGTAWLVRQDRIEDALQGLAFGRWVFPTRGFFDTSIQGLGDIAGPWTPTVEHGAGQWASVGGPDSNHIVNQAYTHLCNQGICRGAADDLIAGIGWNTVSRGIAPGAWMYLAWHGGFWSRL